MIVTYGDALELDLHCVEVEPPRPVALRHAGAVLAAGHKGAEIRRMLPLTHVEFAGHTRDTSSKRHIGGIVARASKATSTWNREAGELTVGLPARWSAVPLRLQAVSER